MESDLQPMRVLLVVARYFPYPQGGLITHVYQLAQRLAQAGVAVTILTTDPSGALPKEETVGGIKVLRVRSWPARADYNFAPGLYRVISSGAWDIVHCHGYHNLVPVVAMIAAWRARIPYILTFHSGGNWTRFRFAIRWLQWPVLRPLMKHAERLIAVSNFEAESFRAQLSVAADRIVVVPNGAQIFDPLAGSSTPAEDHSAASGESASDPLLLSIGRLVPYKGHHRVIAALPLILRQVPNVRLRIVGVGPYEHALRKQARHLGVADRVEIAPVPSGDAQGMTALMQRASLVLLLSDHEGQGLAAYEALTLGRPVLITDATALHDLVVAGLARGVPLRCGTAEVAQAVVDQLSNPLIPLPTQLPTWEETVAGVLAVYQDIITGRPGSLGRRLRHQQAKLAVARSPRDPSTEWSPPSESPPSQPTTVAARQAGEEP